MVKNKSANDLIFEDDEEDEDSKSEDDDENEDLEKALDEDDEEESSDDEEEPKKIGRPRKEQDFEPRPVAPTKGPTVNKQRPRESVEPRVAPKKFVAFKQSEVNGLIDRETNETIATTEWEYRAEVLNRLEEIRDLIGRI